MISSILALCLASLTQAVDVSCKNNLVHYWGQNSFGAINLNNPAVWEKDLNYYCDLNVADIFQVSFLNVFNAGNGRLPEVNFANHCETFFEDQPTLRNCPKIGQDITYCQSKGKTVMLSLGGATGATSFSSPAAAEEFATTLWNMFFKGTHKYRPLGNASLDGVDLDIEGGGTKYYDVFLKKLRQYFASDTSKKYYVSSAPQCPYPDAHLQETLDNSLIDMVYIQFYNNWCGVNNYDNPNAWNWKDWENWAKTKALNKDVKLYLGVPANVRAASSGYVDIEKLKRITRETSGNATFGGVMMWESSQSDNNKGAGGTYGKVTKDYLNAIVGCGNTPSPSPSTTSSTTTVSSTTSASSSSSKPSSSTPVTSVSTTTTTTTTVTQPTGPPTSCTVATCASESKSPVYYDCVHGKPLQRSCSSGTVCRQNANGITCEWSFN